jgi:hypothetical protein
VTKRLADLTDEERLAKTKGLLNWLLDQAKKGNPEAKLALSQIPEVLEKVRANREAGRTPEMRKVSIDGGE